MKKMLAFILALGFIIQASLAFAAAQVAYKGQNAGGGWLYVVSAGVAHVHKAARNHEYVLSLNLPHVNQVTKFSDRPLRIVRHISAVDLKKLWKNSSNSFRADPPNAVLFAENLRPIIVVLKSTGVHGDVASYTFEKPDLFQLPAQLHKVTLAIDAGCGNGGDFPAAG